MWHLYIIRCSDATLYIGITTDVERRFVEHAGQGLRGAKYLRGKDPLSLVFTAPVGTRSEATKLEMKLKKRPKAEKERVISGAKPLSDYM